MPKINCSLPTFQKKLRQLKNKNPDIYKAVVKAIETLKTNPKANSIRMHPLSMTKPTKYKIDISPNHSWQIVLVIEGDIYTLLTIGTHKKVDREI